MDVGSWGMTKWWVPWISLLSPIYPLQGASEANRDWLKKLQKRRAVLDKKTGNEWPKTEKLFGNTCHTPIKHQGKNLHHHPLWGFSRPSTLYPRLWRSRQCSDSSAWWCWWVGSCTSIPHLEKTGSAPISPASSVSSELGLHTCPVTMGLNKASWYSCSPYLWCLMECSR